MKIKSLLFTLTTLLCVGTLPACGRKSSETAPVSTYGDVSKLVREFSSEPDFEVIDVGRLGFSIVKAIVREIKDEDAARLIDAVDKVSSVSITRYEGCPDDVKEEFLSRLNAILDDDDLLLEARRSGRRLQVYGQPSEDGSSVQDLLINIPGEDILVNIKGLIPMDKVSEIAGKTMM